MLRLFNVYIPRSAIALLTSEVVLLFSCYLIAAVSRMNVDITVYVLYGTGLPAMTVVVGTIVLGMYFQDLYAQVRVRSRLLLVQQTSLAIGIAFLAQAGLNYVRPELMLPRWVMFGGSGLALVAVPLWRMTFAKIMVTTVAQRRVVFVGTNEVVEELAQTFDRVPEMGFHCAGFITERTPVPPFAEHRVLGGLLETKRIAEEVSADHIVVGLAEHSPLLPTDDLLQLRVSGIPIERAGSMFGAAFGRIPIREIAAADLLFHGDSPANWSASHLQGIVSWLIAAILSIVAFPMALVIALLVRLTSPGPILIRHLMVGKGNRQFTLYKFRIVSGEGSAQTVTRLGRWLRDFRLDAIPQLWNVLRGEMAIVGPRPDPPEIAYELEHEIPIYRERTVVKPGLTGWAQINLSDRDTLRKLEYDLYYIQHCAFSLDLYIILTKLKMLLLGRMD